MIWLASTLATLDVDDARFLVGVGAVVVFSVGTIAALALFADSGELDAPAGLDDWRRK